MPRFYLENLELFSLVIYHVSMEHNHDPHFAGFEYLGNAMRFAEEIHEVIDHAPLFDELSFIEIETLCQFMVCYAAPRGSVLMREGDTGDFLIVLLTGRAEVLKTNTAGETTKIAEVGPGASLGEMSMIDGQTRFATCLSTEPVDFAVLDRKALNDILISLPRLGNKFLLLLLQLVVGRLREASTRLLPHIGPLAV